MRHSYKKNEQDAAQEGKHGICALSQILLFVQFWHQVAGGNIDKTTRGKRQEKRREIIDVSGNGIPSHRSQYTGQGGNKIETQRLKPAETSVDQDSEISYFLGNFVHYNDQGGNYPKIDAHQETGADNQAVGKVVDGIADKVKVGKSMDRTHPFMAVAPMEISFQHKECHKTQDQIVKNNRAVYVFQGFR